MIDLVSIGTYIAVGVGPLVLVKTFEKRKRIARYFKVLFSSTPDYKHSTIVDDAVYPDVGITYEEHSIEEDDVQYLLRLKKIHKEAYDEYKEHQRASNVNPAYDRTVVLNMLRAEEEPDFVEIGAHVMEFKDGLRVWIENRWYAFGKCYGVSAIHNQIGITADAFVTEYTFLRMVDFYEKRTKFNDWKERHDEYTLDIIQKRKHV